MDNQNLSNTNSMPSISNEGAAILFEVQNGIRQVVQVQEQLTHLEQLLSNNPDNTSDVAAENLRLKQQLALTEDRMRTLVVNDNDSDEVWNDENWKIGHMTQHTLEAINAPHKKPPHLQKNKFPLSCAKCEKGLWDSKDICDDLYPLIPYDGATVYCQSCFNKYIFPLRMEQAVETYRASKERSKERRPKSADTV